MKKKTTILTPKTVLHKPVNVYVKYIKLRKIFKIV